VDLFSRFHGGAHDALGSAVTGGRDRPGIAVRNDVVAVGDKGGAKGPHFPVRCDILIVHALRFHNEHFTEAIEGFILVLPHEPLDAVDGPEQIDRGGAGSRHMGADLFELRPEGFKGVRLDLARSERQSHGRRNADGRRTADPQPLMPRATV
jgi:hypothetical protein